MPAERTTIRSSAPRARNSRISKCSAITLRAVLAAQIRRTERKGGAARSAPPASFGAATSLTGFRGSLGHYFGHALFLGQALGEFFLEPRAQRHRIPYCAALLHLRDRMPSLHQPHRADSRAEHLAVDVLGVVAREP